MNNEVKKKNTNKDSKQQNEIIKFAKSYNRGRFIISLIIIVVLLLLKFI